MTLTTADLKLDRTEIENRLEQARSNEKAARMEAGDIVIDGAEAVIIPVLVATVLMPYLAPSAIVQQLRAERAASVHRPDQGI